MTKRILTALVVFVVIVACIFALGSCKKKHKHTYTSEYKAATCTESGGTVYTCECSDSYIENEKAATGHNHTGKVVAPTCTEKGYTLYTCVCGDTYTENETAALGHDMQDKEGVKATCSAEGYGDYHECSRCGYNDKVVITNGDHSYQISGIVYPTPGVAGSKDLVCSHCGNKVTEDIVATSFILPTATDVIVDLIGDLAVSVHMDPDTVFITNYEYENYADREGYKQFYAVRVADAQLTATSGTPAGYVELDLGYTSISLDGTSDPDDIGVPTQFQSVLTLTLYLEGDVISIEQNIDGKVNDYEYNINELWYNTIGNMLGISYDQLMAVSYVYSEFTAALTEVMELMAAIDSTVIPHITEGYIQDMNELLDFVSGGIITSTTDANTGNVTYHTNIEALNALIEEIEGKTVGEYIDVMYGAGSAESLRSLLISLPDMKIKDIVNATVEIAEANEVDIDTIYDFIDLFVVFAANDYTFSIREVIDTHSNITLGDILADRAENAQSAPDSGIGENATNNDYNGGYDYGYDYGVEPAAEEPEFDREEFIANLKKSIEDALNMILDNDIDGLYNIMTFGDANHIPEGETEVFSITGMLKQVLAAFDDYYYVEFTVDAEGNLLYANLGMNNYDINVDLTDGVHVSLAYQGEDAIVFDYSVVTTDNVDEVSASLVVGGKDYLVYSETLVDGVTTEMLLEIYYDKTVYHQEEIYDEYWDEYYYETYTTTEHTKFLTVAYTYTSAGENLDVIFNDLENTWFLYSTTIDGNTVYTCVKFVSNGNPYLECYVNEVDGVTTDIYLEIFFDKTIYHEEEIYDEYWDEYYYNTYTTTEYTELLELRYNRESDGDSETEYMIAIFEQVILEIESNINGNARYYNVVFSDRETGEQEITADVYIEESYNADGLLNLDLVAQVQVGNEGLITMSYSIVDGQLNAYSYGVYNLTDAEGNALLEPEIIYTMQFFYDDDGNPHVYGETEDATFDFSVTEVEGGYVYALVGFDGEEQLVDMAFEITNTEEGLYIGFDTSKLLTETRKDPDFVEYDEYGYATYLYHIYKYLEIHGGILITIK